MNDENAQSYVWAEKLKKMEDEKKLYESSFNALLTRINTARIKHLLSLELYEFLANGKEDVLKEGNNEV